MLKKLLKNIIKLLIMVMLIINGASFIFFPQYVENSSIKIAGFMFVVTAVYILFDLLPELSTKNRKSENILDRE